MAPPSGASRRVRRGWIALASALIAAFSIVILLQWRSGYSYCIRCARVTTSQTLELRWADRPGSRIALLRRQQMEPANALTMYLDPAGQCVHEWRSQGSRLLSLDGRVDARMYCPVCLTDLAQPDFSDFLNAQELEDPGFRDELHGRIEDGSVGEWLLRLYAVWQQGNQPPNGTNVEK